MSSIIGLSQSCSKVRYDLYWPSSIFIRGFMFLFRTLTHSLIHLSILLWKRYSVLYRRLRQFTPSIGYSPHFPPRLISLFLVYYQVEASRDVIFRLLAMRVFSHSFFFAWLLRMLGEQANVSSGDFVVNPAVGLPLFLRFFSSRWTFSFHFFHFAVVGA